MPNAQTTNTNTQPGRNPQGQSPQSEKSQSLGQKSEKDVSSVGNNIEKDEPLARSGGMKNEGQSQGQNNRSSSSAQDMQASRKSSNA